jgi:hypothetical protein
MNQFKLASTPKRRVTRPPLLPLTCLLLSAITLGGCSNAKQGAVSGAGVGALSGLAIGSLSGDAGKGAAVGAVVGGIGGAFIGDQNRRRGAHAGSNQTAPVASSPGQTETDRQRLTLAKLTGSWTVSGWETIDGKRQMFSGTAVGAVEANYFLRMEMRISPDGQPGQESTGSLLFGAEPGRGLTMTSRFDTSPSSMSYAGVVSADGQTFTLDERNHSGVGGRQIVIRFLSDREFIADVANGTGRSAVPQASLRFSGAQ